MRWYRDFIATAPEDLSGFFAFLTSRRRRLPGGAARQKVCGIFWCYTGPLDEADEVFAPIRAIGPPLWTASADAVPGIPERRSTRSTRRACSGIGRPTSSSELPDEAIDAPLEFGAQHADPAIDHAPLPDRRRGPPGRPQRHRLQLPRCDLGAGDRRRRSRSGQRGTITPGRATTGRRCTRIPPAAPT